MKLFCFLSILISLPVFKTSDFFETTDVGNNCGRYTEEDSCDRESEGKCYWHGELETCIDYHPCIFYSRDKDFCRLNYEFCEFDLNTLECVECYSEGETANRCACLLDDRERCSDMGCDWKKVQEGYHLCADFPVPTPPCRGSRKGKPRNRER